MFGFARLNPLTRLSGLVNKMIEKFESDLEKAQYLQNLLLGVATGQPGEEADYQGLRRYFLDHQAVRKLLPGFVRTNRSVSQFWQFIKTKFPSYAERRKFIWSEFTPALDFLEGKTPMPSEVEISDGLKIVNKEGIESVWSKALERLRDDPEGAITSARTLLETVCKHILDEEGIQYSAQRAELSELYKLTATALRLSPSQHTEEIFKQILGGCSAVVNGLGTLRNRLGDAHGRGKSPVKPAPRHANLAVNLAGSVALFIIETWNARRTEG